MKEIAQIAPLLAEENLEFLKHQAEVLLHSARIGSLNHKADLTSSISTEPEKLTGM